MSDKEPAQSGPALGRSHLELTDRLGPMVGGGSERQVYHWNEPHPLLAKVLHSSAAVAPECSDPSIVEKKGWLDLRRRNSIFESEQRTWLSVLRQYPRMRRPPPIAELRGVAITAEGPVQLAAQVSTAKGELAPTLKSLVGDGIPTSEVLDWMTHFARELFAWNIPVHDLQPGNIVLETHGPEPRLVLVDGFGEKKSISLRYLLASYNAPHIHDHLTACARMLRCRWDEKNKKFLSLGHGTD